MKLANMNHAVLGISFLLLCSTSTHSQNLERDTTVAPSDNIKILWIQIQEGQAENDVRAYCNTMNAYLSLNAKVSKDCKAAQSRLMSWVKKHSALNVELLKKYGSIVFDFDPDTGKAKAGALYVH